MATQSFKLYHNAASDGVAYIDLPRAGTLVGIRFSAQFVAGAGGVGFWFPEVSRAPVNQTTVSNAKGVLGSMAVSTSAASQGGGANIQLLLSERCAPGDRIYLNCAAAANFGSGITVAYLDIQ